MSKKFEITITGSIANGMFSGTVDGQFMPQPIVVASEVTKVESLPEPPYPNLGDAAAAGAIAAVVIDAILPSANTTVPEPSVPVLIESPNGTIVMRGSGEKIVDKNRDVWTIADEANGRVAKNGGADRKSWNVKKITYINGEVYHTNDLGDHYQIVVGKDGWHKLPSLPEVIAVVSINNAAGTPLVVTESPKVKLLSGASISGLESGAKDGRAPDDSVIPGVYGTQYIAPSDQEIAYLANAGFKSVRIPFLWERTQLKIDGDLNEDEMVRLDNIITTATDKNMSIILCPYQFGRRYGQVIGQSEYTADMFANFWSKIAMRYKNRSNVMFELQHEPTALDVDILADTHNVVIAGIRATGATNQILVPGGAWSYATQWVSSGSDKAMLKVVDPGNNMAFAVHEYFDNFTGQCVIGADKGLNDFTNWLKMNGKKGFMTEMGVPSTPECDQVLKDVLQHMNDNADNGSGGWIGWSVWAAGPWWGDNPYSIEPKSFDPLEEKPIMGIYKANA